MNEPDVTLTDYAIALESFVFCTLLFRQSGFQILCRWFILFFAAIGLAAFTGGTAHGFFPVHGTFMHDALWLVSIISIGLMAVSGWTIGIYLLKPAQKTIITVKALAGLGFLAYVCYVSLVSQAFLVAILNYLPAAIFLLGVFIYRYLQTPRLPIALGIVAMILTFTSSFVQHVRIALHPVYFDHNALYHLIQMIALLLLFLSSKYFIDDKGTSHA